MSKITRLIGATPKSGPLTSYSTTFPATENPLSEGGIWIGGGSVGQDWTDPQTTGGSPGVAWPTMLGADGTNYNDSIAVPNGWSGDDHTITATIYNDGNPGDYESELLNRFLITPHGAQGYEVDIIGNFGGLLYIVRWNGPHNSWTQIAGGISSGVSTANGAVWKSVMSGSTLTVYCNGNQVYSQDLQAWAVANGGSYFAHGSPGMGFWNENPPAGSSPAKHFGFSSWAATNP